MKYEKEVNIDGKEYVFALKENCELIFYTINKEYDPFSALSSITESFLDIAPRE